MTNFKEVLRKADEFQKLAENPKKEFLKKVSQSELDKSRSELDKAALGKSGLDSLITSLSSQLSNVYLLIDRLNKSAKDDSYLQSVVAVSDFKFGSLFTIFNKYLLPFQASLDGNANSIQTSSIKAEKAIQGVKLLNSELSKISGSKNSLVSQLMKSLNTVQSLANQVHRYESVRSEWTPTDDSHIEELGQGTVGLSDSLRNLRYQIRQLHFDPNYQTPEAVSKVRAKLEASKSELSPSVYRQYVEELNKAERNLKNKLKNMPSVTPDVTRS
jgi:hypothetical protein